MMSSWCSGGVFGGTEGTVFPGPKWLTCQYQIGINGDATLCYWGCMMVNS